jgi:hypothetical protein
MEVAGTLPRRVPLLVPRSRGKSPRHFIILPVKKFVNRILPVFSLKWNCRDMDPQRDVLFHAHNLKPSAGPPTVGCNISLMYNH